MHGHSFTLVKKVAAGYLLLVLFCLVAIGYALTGLHRQTKQSQELVDIEFKASTLLRSLRQNLLTQERLFRQALVLRDEELGLLFLARSEEFGEQWQQLGDIPGNVFADLHQAVEHYRAAQAPCRELLQRARWDETGSCSEELGRARDNLLGTLDRNIADSEGAIDRQLAELTAQSRRAYRITALLALLGIGLSAPVVATVVIGIHRSVRELLEATRQIAEGRFDPSIPLDRRDEFGQLAREFAHMGEKLRELKESSLDANPLTRLPGNLALERELTARIESGEPFSQLYFDLDHFKVYNDRYGYQAGSEIIARVGVLIRETLESLGGTDDLLGHVGGDDYVVLTVPERAEAIAQQVIRDFDHMIPSCYSAEDVAAGAFTGVDRYGVERVFPLLTISIAIIDSQNLETSSAAAIGRESARMKEHLKSLPGSNYLRNRRHRLG